MRRFGLKEFSFLHALVLSLMVHALIVSLAIPFESDRADLLLDSAPGKAAMRFSFPRKRKSGYGDAAKQEKTEEEQQEEGTQQIDPGVLTQEISKIMRQISYPPLARRMGMQGTVRFEIQTDAEGKVKHLVMLQSSGYDLLDRTAARSLETWTFPFANSRFIIPVRFMLQ